MNNILALLQCIQPTVSKTNIRQLSRIIFAMLAMTGRVTMLGISRWAGKEGSYRTVQRFFYQAVPWVVVFWMFFYQHLYRPEDEYILAGDESVITKSGKHTYGVDRFFSGLLGQPVKSIANFALSLINVKSRRSYPTLVEQVIRTEAEKEAAKARTKKRKVKKGKQTTPKGKPGRPKGSKNKDKTKVEFTPELLRIQNNTIKRLERYMECSIYLLVLQNFRRFTTHCKASGGRKMKAVRILGLLFVLMMFGVLSGHAVSQQPMALDAGPQLAPLTAPTTLNLDGVGDYVRVPNHSNLNPGGAITIEAWVRRSDSNRCETVIGKNHVTGFWLGFCNSSIRYYTNGGGTSQDGVRAVPADEWTHIAVTFDGTTRRYYINGMLDYESTSPTSLPVNTDNLGIGANPDGSYAFQGNLAEVRIWSIARSQQDIRRDMVRLINASRLGLIAVWRLEGSANEVFGNHSGTLIGDANFTGPAAPPVDHDPISIPRLVATANVNGTCSTGEYGQLRLPIWYGDVWAVNNLAWAYVGATATDIYVCMEQLQWGSYPNQFASVYIDPDDDAGAVAQSDDYRVNLEWPSNTSSSERGTGAGSYTTPGLTNYAADADGFDFDWTAEFRIGRDALPASNPIFRMQFVHQWLSAVSDDYGWPVDFDWNTPDAWERFWINDEGGEFDVQIQAIEVTQGVRTNIPSRVPPSGISLLPADNSFQTHVAERRTIVRVYPWIQVNSGSTAPLLSAELHGFDQSGFEFPDSPLSPQNTTLIPDPALSLSNLRKEAARSWNFVLPVSWTVSGQIRLEAVANPPGPRFVPECDGCSDNRVILWGVRFMPVGQVTLIPYILRWANVSSGGAVTWVTPNSTELAGMFSYLHKTWPIADLRFRGLYYVSTCILNGTTCTDPYTSGPASPQARQRADVARLGVSPGDPILFPAIISTEADTRGGRMGCRGSSGVPGPDYWLGACDPTFVHESAHAGPARKHAGGIHGSIGAVDLSYPDPHGGVEANSYGFDIFAMQAIPPVGSTTHTHDYMSYGRDDLVWTSRYTWDGIRTWLGGSTATITRSAPKDAQVALQSTTPYLRLSGDIETGGSSSINPAFQVELPTGVGDSPGQGSYELTLIDGAGKTVFVRQFEPNVSHTDDWTNDGVETIDFVEDVPLLPGLAQVILRYNGQVLASRTASPDTPIISLLTPTAGEKWASSGTATVSWSVIAAGGDNLMFLVEGSPDGGATWTWLSGSEGGTEAEVDLTNLPGVGSDWTIRLQASDGLNVGTAEANPIEIEAKPPQVFILNPNNGDTANPTQEVLLLGQAFDWLDGQLSDNQLVWQVDGQTVGNGTAATISGLSEGQHIIALQANSSSGLQSTVSYTITVSADSEFDGLPDAWENKYGLDPQTPNASEDPDKDGLANWRELDAGTSPVAADTDLDGFSDKEEVDAGSDPVDPNSTPRSGEGSKVYLPLIDRSSG